MLGSITTTRSTPLDLSPSTLLPELELFQTRLTHSCPDVVLDPSELALLLPQARPVGGTERAYEAYLKNNRWDSSTGSEISLDTDSDGEADLRLSVDPMGQTTLTYLNLQSCDDAAVVAGAGDIALRLPPEKVPISKQYKIAPERRQLVEQVAKRYTPKKVEELPWTSMDPATQEEMRQKAQELITAFYAGGETFADSLQIEFTPDDAFGPDAYGFLAMIGDAQEGEKHRVRFGVNLLQAVYGNSNTPRHWLFTSTMYHEYSHLQFDDTKYATMMEELGLDISAYGLNDDEAYLVFYYPINEIATLTRQIAFNQDRLGRLQTPQARGEMVAHIQDLRSQRTALFQQLQMVTEPEQSAALLEGIAGDLQSDLVVFPDDDIEQFRKTEEAFAQWKSLPSDNPDLKNKVVLNRFRPDILLPLDDMNEKTGKDLLPDEIEQQFHALPYRFEKLSPDEITPFLWELMPPPPRMEPGIIIDLKG